MAGAGPFPITPYDRPSLAIANLLSGDIDATTRAIFSPMTLTPTEVKTIRTEVLGKDGEQNPLLKTAVDLATNPIVILGLVLALGPWGKIATPMQMHTLWTEGGQFLKGVSPSMNSLLSPFTAMRSLWKFGINKLLDGYTNTLGKFDFIYRQKYHRMWGDLAAEMGRQPTPVERMSVIAHNMGFHTTEAPLLKAYHFALDKTKPLAPNLEAWMNKQHPALLKAARKHRDFFNHTAKLMKIEDPTNKAFGEIWGKGVEFIPHYAPQVTGSTGLLEKFLYGSRPDLAALYRKIMPEWATKAKARFLRARSTLSLPDQASLEITKELFDPAQYAKLMALEQKQIGWTATRMGGFMEGALRLVKGNPAIAAFPKEMKTELREILKFARGKGPHIERIEEVILRNAKDVMVGKMTPDNFKKFVGDLSAFVGAPPRYPLDPHIIIPAYIKAMGPTYAWHVKGFGAKANAIITKEGGPLVRAMWDDDLKLMLRGFRHPKEYARSITFKTTLHRTRMWLADPHSPAQRFIPTDARKYLVDLFSGKHGYLSEATVGGQLSSLLYTSALGLNISPISKNLMQNWITTLNMLGPGNMALGMKRVAAGLSKWAQLTPKIGSDRAFKMAFPGYFKHFGYEGITRAMAAGDIAKESQMAVSLARGGWEKIKRFVMTPFAVSEKFNRLVAFYSGQEAALVDGLSKAQARYVGANIMRFTQFPGGVLGLSKITRGLPAWGRQFTHFPLRFLEFLYGSLRYGPEGKFSTGIIGRTMAGSAGLYTVAKNMLGVDISKGLMFSALPFPEYPQSPFFPFPLVPPAVGIVGDIGKAIATGEFRGVPGRVGALLAPGGLAVRRGWRTWHPKYADYRRRTPDGRIPVYNEKGMLISTQTPMELTMRGLGIRPATVQAEQDLTKYLLTQREEIRQYRRQYLEALVENDLEKARKLNDEFKKQYPSLGPIQVKKSDIKAVQNRKQTSRLHRILKGFPKAYRPLFESMIEQAGLIQLARDIEFNPSALQQYLPMAPTSQPPEAQTSPVGQNLLGL